MFPNSYYCTAIRNQVEDVEHMKQIAYISKWHFFLKIRAELTKRLTPENTSQMSWYAMKANKVHWSS